jgi:hypothetical protein
VCVGCIKLSRKIVVETVLGESDDLGTDVVKDAHLIAYGRYMLENDIKENFFVLQTD